MGEIAVVGGGAAGMAAAYALNKAGHRVSLIERELRLGGHLPSWCVACPDGSTVWVDIGVSDFNRASFTNIGALLDELGVAYFPVSQDAAYMAPDGKTHWYVKQGAHHFVLPIQDEARFLAEVTHFNAQCLEVLEDPDYGDWTLAHYLDHHGYSETFRQLYLYPNAQGSLPMPDVAPADYNIRALVSLWRYHGSAGPSPGFRYVVKGGMHVYSTAFCDWLRQRQGQILLASEVLGIQRQADKVHIRLVHEGVTETRSFTHVVIATGVDGVISLLEDASDEEKRAYEGFQGQRAEVVIHQDPALMPDRREAWSAYNYLITQAAMPPTRPVLSYYANQLAQLDACVPDTFITVNPHRPPAHEKVLARHLWTYPSVTATTERARARVDQLQGKRNTWYAGAYLAQPSVQEQAFVSGLDAAERLLKRNAAQHYYGELTVDAFFTQINLFKGLDTVALADVQRVAECFSLAAGDILFRQGSAPDGMYLLKSGAISLSMRTPGNDEIAIGTIGSGKILGEMSLLDRDLRSATARAVEPTHGYFISLRKFDALRADFRPSTFDLMDRIGCELARKLRQSITHIAVVPLQGQSRGPALKVRTALYEDAVETPAQLLELARNLKGFAAFTAKEFAQLIALGRASQLKRGTVLCLRGEPPEELFLVLRGALRSSTNRYGSLEQIGIYGPGSAVGIVAILDGAGQPADFDVREDALLLRIDQSSVEHIRKGYSELSFKLFHNIYTGLTAELRRLNRYRSRIENVHRALDGGTPDV